MTTAGRLRFKPYVVEVRITGIREATSHKAIIKAMRQWASEQGWRVNSVHAYRPGGPLSRHRPRREKSPLFLGKDFS